MLVLKRKLNQVVCIGDDVRITVTKVRGDSVYLGFEAPRDLAVHREEVYEAIRREALADSDNDRARRADLDSEAYHTGDGA